MPSTIAQYFLPNELSSQQAISAWEQRTNFTAASLGGAMLAYRPVLIAQASVRYQDRKTQVYTPRQYAYLVPERRSRRDDPLGGFRDPAARSAPRLRRAARRRLLRRSLARHDRQQADDSAQARDHRRDLHDQAAARALQLDARPLRRPGRRLCDLPLAASADCPRAARRRNGRADREVRQGARPHRRSAAAQGCSGSRTRRRNSPTSSASSCSPPARRCSACSRGGRRLRSRA